MSFPFDASGTFGAPQAPTGTSRGVPEFFGGGTGPSFGGEDFLGGGGFLQAGSFLTQAQQQQGPQISLVPIKVALLYRAWQRDPNSLQVSLFPSGPVLHLVKLLGIPEPPPKDEIERDLQSARVRFFLCDFSGRIECEFTVGEELTEYKHSQIMDALFSGGLITVFGSVNLLGKEEPSLRVHAIRKANTAAEVLFHETNCQVAFLRLKFRGDDRGSPDAHLQALQQPQSMPPYAYGQHQPHDYQIGRNTGQYGPFGAS